MVINNNDNADKTKVDKVIHDVEQDRILAFQSLFGEKYKIFLKYEKLFVDVTHTYNGIIIVTDIFDYNGKIIYIQDMDEVHRNTFQLLAYCCMFGSISLDDHIESVLYKCRNNMPYNDQLFHYLKEHAISGLRTYVCAQILLHEMADDK